MTARRLAVPLAFAALTALAGCGGVVAEDAPALLSPDAIAARAAEAEDTQGGVRAASALAWRAAQLRERAARLRRTTIADGERLELERRATALKQQQG